MPREARERVTHTNNAEAAGMSNVGRVELKVVYIHVHVLGASGQEPGLADHIEAVTPDITGTVEAKLTKETEDSLLPPGGYTTTRKDILAENGSFREYIMRKVTDEDVALLL